MKHDSFINDLQDLLASHGLSGVSETLTTLIGMVVTTAGQALLGRFIRGATLFAVDDSGSVSVRLQLDQPTNAALLDELLRNLTPQQLRSVLEVINQEVRATAARCTCLRCVARRAESSSPANPIEKGALEAAFTLADDTNCRSTH